MLTNGESKFPYFLVGMGLGAIVGLLFAPRSGEETRKYFRERGTKGFDALNQQAGKLRETADVIVQQGKKLMPCKRSDSAADSNEEEKQTYQEDRRENLGG